MSDKKLFKKNYSYFFIILKFPKFHDITLIIKETSIFIQKIMYEEQTLRKTGIRKRKRFYYCHIQS